ncbi:MAG: septum formation initiator family protein [Candidatus Nanopelagicales bacterium]
MFGLHRPDPGSTDSGSGAVDADGARRSFVSSRTAILLGIAVVAVILLALPLREYLAQRGEINSASQKMAEQQAKVDSLQKQVDDWQDEDFIRGQARERLHFLLPGEVGYKIIDPGTTENKLAERAPQTDGPSGPWYDRLWNSMRAAEKSDS